MTRILPLLCLLPMQVFANCQQLTIDEQASVVGVDATIREIRFVRNDIFTALPTTTTSSPPNKRYARTCYLRAATN